MISFLAIYLTGKKPTLKYSYGYHRADVLGALASVFIIWSLLVWLLIEATHRLQNPTEINGELMLGVACFGLGCNLMNLFILTCCCNQKNDKGENMHLWESIASAYKPYSGNKITSAIKSQRSKSNRGSTLSASAKRSELRNFDADNEDAGPAPEEP